MWQCWKAHGTDENSQEYVAGQSHCSSGGQLIKQKRQTSGDLSQCQRTAVLHWGVASQHLK